MNTELEQEVHAREAACQLCGRSQLPLTKHHLIPQSRHNERMRAKHRSARG